MGGGEKPRFAVWGGRMNLRKQVEPLLSAALQASSKQRRAQRATSRLAWDLRWLRRASENHHEQSRSVTILSCDPGRVKARHDCTCRPAKLPVSWRLVRAPHQRCVRGAWHVR